MSAYSLDLSLGLVLSPTPDFGSICHEKTMGARSGDFGSIVNGRNSGPVNFPVYFVF